MDKYYKIIIYTENTPGILNKISNVFRRKKINIESLSAFKYNEEIHEINIYLKTEERDLNQIVKKISGTVDVFSAHSYEINKLP